MNFQTHYDRYLQNIHRTQITGEATQNSHYIHTSKPSLKTCLLTSAEAPSRSHKNRDNSIRLGDPILLQSMGCCLSVILKRKRTAGIWTHSLVMPKRRMHVLSKTLTTSFSPTSLNSGCTRTGNCARQQTSQTSLKS